MANLVVHFEIHATEPQKLLDFYSQLFNWKFTQYGEMSYWMIDTGDGAINTARQPGHGINGGLTEREGPRPEPGSAVNGCNIVVGVADADAAFAKALELGGTEAMALEDMEGIGRTAYILDPDNNLFGILSEVFSDGTNVMDGTDAGA
ncbi:VOC family protein [Salinibacterium hongtaonis]|uniref:VOC family protein n=1 Tax=Homoserinimonas hongtaonis TaxID=2079791 RepID=UPI000D36378C|nr:VOC family protein [Salinibacterium hongtaonis]AWB90358.1 glyoxalase [Salinibacterium hongtaonis]